MAKKSYRKMTPVERARQQANQERLEQVIARRLERDGLTRAEIWARLGLPGRRAQSGRRAFD